MISIGSIKLMKKKSFFKIPRPYVFVPMSADFFHYGHLNLLLKAKKYGNLIVGLMTDKGIESYKKKKPLIKYNLRKKILKHIDCIDHIIPLNGLEYLKTAKKYKLDYFVHGDDWKNGPQSEERLKLIKGMRNWNGKVIEFVCTKSISSTIIKKKILLKWQD